MGACTTEPELEEQCDYGRLPYGESSAHRDPARWDGGEAREDQGVRRGGGVEAGSPVLCSPVVISGDVHQPPYAWLQSSRVWGGAVSCLLAGVWVEQYVGLSVFISRPPGGQGRIKDAGTRAVGRSASLWILRSPPIGPSSVSLSHHLVRRPVPTLASLPSAVWFATQISGEGLTGSCWGVNNLRAKGLTGLANCTNRIAQDPSLLPTKQAWKRPVKAAGLSREVPPY